MDPQALTILLVEDDTVDREATSRHLRGEHELVFASTAKEGREAVLRNGQIDCVLLDFHLPDEPGLNALGFFVERQIPVILFTGAGSEDVAVEAMKRGAQDYLVKGKVTSNALRRAIRGAVEVVKLKRELAEKHRLLEERTAEAETRALQLRRYAKILTQTEQRERRRLSNILHNHLQQLMTAAVMRLEGLRRYVADEHPALSILQESQELLRDCIRQARMLNVEISPPVLHHAGLADALHWLAQWMRETHGLEVAVEADAAADPASEELKNFLFEAARELLFNAVKHGGVSEAAVRLEPIDTQTLILTVTDEGAGCDLSALEQSSDGIGIFSISERIELFGGRVEIKSRPGDGFRAAIYAPITPSEEAADTDASSDELRHELDDDRLPADGEDHIRILVADDHKLVREGLVSILQEQRDFEVVAEAPDGRAAFHLALETHPDVIVTDVNMPGMNGIEATRLIKQSLPNIPVIALSVNDDENTMRAMRDAGAAAYVKKEAASDELCEAIRSVCAARLS